MSFVLENVEIEYMRCPEMPIRLNGMGWVYACFGAILYSAHKRQQILSFDSFTAW
jgi:hypothetical protein